MMKPLTPPPCSHKRGFTLLEMSMVMAVIGLILGGIMIGSEMIRGAEVNAILTEQRAFQIALSNFQQKYNAVPGDMRNAARYWPDEVDGNNNGRIDWNESDYAWRQLSKAGFISGSYDGTGDVPTTATDSPGSRIPNGAWSFLETMHAIYATAWFDNPDYFQKMFLQLKQVGSNTPVLTPSEAYGLDMKMDDGVPYRGKVLGTPTPNACTSGVSGSYIYDTTIDTQVCIPAFLLVQ